MDRFKWTPSEVQALSLAEIMRIVNMMSAEAKAKKQAGGRG